MRRDSLSLPFFSFWPLPQTRSLQTLTGCFRTRSPPLRQIPTPSRSCVVYSSSRASSLLLLHYSAHWKRKKTKLKGPTRIRELYLQHIRQMLQLCLQLKKYNYPSCAANGILEMWDYRDYKSMESFIRLLDTRSVCYLSLSRTGFFNSFFFFFLSSSLSSSDSCSDSEPSSLSSLSDPDPLSSLPLPLSEPLAESNSEEENGRGQRVSYYLTQNTGKWRSPWHVIVYTAYPVTNTYCRRALCKSKVIFTLTVRGKSSSLINKIKFTGIQMSQLNLK